MLERGRWHEIGAFAGALEEHRASVGSAEYFNNPRHQWLRDAWIAHTFARHTGAARLRLAGNGDWPDFCVELDDGRRISCEATEADLPDRRRGNEYKVWQQNGYKPRHDPEADWRKRRDAIPVALDRAVVAKLAKGYPRGVAALVIYLNLGTYDEWREEIEPEIVAHTERALTCFSSVWVLWSARLYKCWPGGIPRVVSGSPD